VPSADALPSFGLPSADALPSYSWPLGAARWANRYTNAAAARHLRHTSATTEGAAGIDEAEITSTKADQVTKGSRKMTFAVNDQVTFAVK
jgi:hypothetical protein